jgi:hypothetical protein
MQPVRFAMLTGGEAYFMTFRAARERPEPEKIRPCED